MRFSPKSAGRRALIRADMTSMIDVIFLLLIYFIISSTIAAPESRLSSSLAVDRAAGGAAADLPPVIIEHEPRAEGDAYRVGQRTLATQAELTEFLRTVSSEQGVFVRAPDAARAAWAAAALQACRDAGLSRMTYVPRR